MRWWCVVPDWWRRRFGYQIFLLSAFATGIQPFHQKRASSRDALLLPSRLTFGCDLRSSIIWLTCRELELQGSTPDFWISKQPQIRYHDYFSLIDIWYIFRQLYERGPCAWDEDYADAAFNHIGLGDSPQWQWMCIKYGVGFDLLWPVPY